MTIDKKKKLKNNKKPSRKQNKCDKPVNKKQYDHEQLLKALNDISNDMAVRKASREYNIPRGTLQDRLHGRVPEDVRRKGPRPVLTKVEKEAVANWCRNLVKSGFPLKKEDLLNTIARIIKDDNRETQFKDSRPGVKWFNFFMNRQNLTARFPESISKGRAVITEKLIRGLFSGLLKCLEEEGFEDIFEDPTKILNGDETSLQLYPKTDKVIAPIGYKNVYQRVQKKKQSLFCFFSLQVEKHFHLVLCFLTYVLREI